MDELKAMHKRMAHSHNLRKRQDEQGARILTIVAVVTRTRDADGNLVGDEPATSTVAPTTTQVQLLEVTTSIEPIIVMTTVTPSPSPTAPSTTLVRSTTSKSKTSSSLSSSSTSASSSESSSSKESSSSLTVSSTHSSSLSSQTIASITSSSSSTASTSAAAASSSGGMSVGAYAGIIGGGVAVALLVLGIFALVYRRKNGKSKNYTKPEDEKALNRQSAVFQNNERFTPSPVQTAPAKAPRLSLLPMTNFMPGLAGADKAQSNNQSPRDAPGGLKQPPAALLLNSNSEKDSSFGGAQPSPAMSAFSDATTAAPGQGSPSPVHRIMIDFNPSMGDELELRTGELVRMLHEYDDGWALCIRMDRSQQGVCPRTCLSQRPVKPRPPPGGAGPRPAGPNSPRGPPNMSGPPRPQNGSRPSSPAMNGRPQSPGMGPRPQSPGMGPRNGPGPQGRPPIKIRPPPAGGPQRSGPSSPGPNSPRAAQPTRPESPAGRQPHPLSKMQKEDDVEFHAM